VESFIRIPADGLITGAALTIDFDAAMLAYLESFHAPRCDQPHIEEYRFAGTVATVRACRCVGAISFSFSETPSPCDRRFFIEYQNAKGRGVVWGGTACTQAGDGKFIRIIGQSDAPGSLTISLRTCAPSAILH
jgi:hypothetical protein